MSFQRVIARSVATKQSQPQRLLRFARNDMSRILILVNCVIFLCGFNFLSVFKNEEGNKYYKKGQVGKAKSAYQIALKGDPKSPEIAFNLGNAYYKEESFKNSLGVYKKAAESAKDPELRSKSFYNLGNTLYRGQDTEKAVQFYKQALRVNPRDQDAKYNLELLTKKSKEDQKKDDKKDKQNQNNQQKDQQNQGGGQGQSSDQKDQKQDPSQGGGGGAGKEEEQQGKGQSGSQDDREEEKKEDQQQGLGQGQEDENKKDDQKEQQSSAAQEEEKGQEQPKPTEAQLRAEQILDALENQEQKILKMSGDDRQVKRAQKYVEKDW